MRIAIATTQAPFTQGGAELHTGGLVRSLREYGHETEIIQFPFRYGDAPTIRRSIRIWQSEDLGSLAGSTPDLVISLKFPAYYASHPNAVLWLMHQHRSIYELWQPTDDADERSLRHEIQELDRKALGNISRRFTTSARVSERLLENCGVSSEPLPPPLFDATRFYAASALPYIFFPSRLESLKRQDLLIEAMRLARPGPVALISGEGGQMGRYREMISRLGLEARVKLLGRISDEQLSAYYAHSTCVFFGPKDEDYGYITVEAMLSRKPVITCRDSGGPLSLVEHGVTGLVVEPNPRAVADAIDRVFADLESSREMGRRAEDKIRATDLTWRPVVNKLLG
jgi:glycosyltransferase involved in cell wall biosynthesis